jgi:hypothetical protein
MQTLAQQVADFFITEKRKIEQNLNVDSQQISVINKKFNGSTDNNINFYGLVQSPDLTNVERQAMLYMSILSFARNKVEKAALSNLIMQYENCLLQFIMNKKKKIKEISKEQMHQMTIRKYG